MVPAFSSEDGTLQSQPGRGGKVNLPSPPCARENHSILGVQRNSLEVTENTGQEPLASVVSLLASALGSAMGRWRVCPPREDGLEASD